MGKPMLTPDECPVEVDLKLHIVWVRLVLSRLVSALPVRKSHSFKFNCWRGSCFWGAGLLAVRL